MKKQQQLTKVKQKILNQMKQKHLLQKKEEAETIKKRLKVLESEIDSIERCA